MSVIIFNKAGELGGLFISMSIFYRQYGHRADKSCQLF